MVTNDSENNYIETFVFTSELFVEIATKFIMELATPKILSLFHVNQPTNISPGLHLKLS